MIQVYCSYVLFLTPLVSLYGVKITLKMEMYNINLCTQIIYQKQGGKCNKICIPVSLLVSLINTLFLRKTEKTEVTAIFR